MDSEVSTLWKWYVYELRDPDTLEVFYVGKGSAGRVESHDADNFTDKGLRIAEINHRGKEPVRVIVGRFEDEAQAFAAEALLIKWVYGKSSLTNKIHGQRHKFIRSFEQKENRVFDHIEGIDIPPTHHTSMMQLVELESAVETLRMSKPELASTIEELTDLFIAESAKILLDSNLTYRATATRISFFKIPTNNVIDLKTRRLDGQVCRIFFRSQLSSKGRLHISFNRSLEDDFKPVSDSHFQVQYGKLNGITTKNMVDLVINRPSSWHNNKGLIIDLFSSALKA